MTTRLIIGMGKSGCAVAHYLRAQGLPYRCVDDRPFEALSAEAQDLAAGAWETCPEQALLDVSEVIISPGVAADHPLVAKARQRRVDVLAEIEFAFRLAAAPVVAVTGSNGKSTTVTLIDHLLRHSGCRSALCGNIGQPFTAALNASIDYYVVEVSSFQLEWIQTFRPHVGVLLNVTADHLDRHLDMQHYEAAKLRLFENQRTDDVAIVDERFQGRVPGMAIREWVAAADHRLGDRVIELGDGCRVAIDRFKLMGTHNRSNLLFAVIAVSHLLDDLNHLAEGIASFQGLEHRLEIVGELQGRIWVNDSKATNPASTQVAIEAMTKPYVLILGGSDKDTDFSQLDFTGRNPKAIVAYGDTGQKAVRQLGSQQVTYVPRFDDACSTAQRLAGPGDVVLLAPACASFDQFSSYTHRGARFKQLFHGREVCS